MASILSRTSPLRVAGIGVAAGCFGTWFEMSHGVLCIPVMNMPPLQLSHQVAAGCTVFGVATRQMLSATLYGLDPRAEVDGIESLNRIIDVRAAGILSLSGTLSSVACVALSAKMPAHRMRRLNGFFLAVCAFFIQWRERRFRKEDATPEDLLCGDDLPATCPGPRPNPDIIVKPKMLPTLGANAQDDTKRLLGLGAASGAVLGLCGVGPAWMLAPVLCATAKEGQLGYDLIAAEEKNIGPKLDNPSENFENDERTRTTACFGMILPCIAAAFRHWQVGHVPNVTGIAIPLAAGAILGSAVAGRELVDVPCDKEIQQFVSLMLLANGCWNMWRQ